MPCVFVSTRDNIRLHWLYEVVLVGKEPWAERQLYIEINGIADVFDEEGGTITCCHRGRVWDAQNLTKGWHDAREQLADDEMGDWFARFLNDEEGVGGSYGVREPSSASSKAELEIGAGGSVETSYAVRCGPDASSALGRIEPCWADPDEEEAFFTTFEFHFQTKSTQVFRVGFRTDFGVKGSYADLRFTTHGPDRAFDEALGTVSKRERRCADRGDAEAEELARTARQRLEGLGRGRQMDKYDLAVLAHPTFSLLEEGRSQAAKPLFGTVDYAPFEAGSPATFFAYDMNNTQFVVDFWVRPPDFPAASPWIADLMQGKDPQGASGGSD